MSTEAVESPEAPWFEAIRKGDLDQVQELLRATPALLDAKTPEGFSPLMLAVYQSQRDIVDYLFDSTPVPGFFEAVVLGQIERVRELCEADASLAKAKYVDGRPAVILAEHYGHEAVVKYLKEKAGV